jgi:formate hydrogenlyase subunit 3/multisubunit Na+/H+ antiporter MnhD subunit
VVSTVAVPESPTLLAAAVALPLALLLAGAAPRLGARMLGLLWAAPLPALAASLLAVGGEARSEPLLLGMALALDPVGAMLLGPVALLWSAAGAYAGAYLRGKPHGERFAAFWLLTQAGSLGVFLAADLASFYLAFALASLAAYGLVVHEETPRARRAARIYLILAVLGETCLLLGFMVVATAADSLLIRDAAAALPGSPWRDLALALLVAGFGLKAGLVPLHVWLPLAHPAAPTPASAVLSGAIIKAGVIGLIRFLPPEAAPAGWGLALVWIGFGTAFYGVAAGVTQEHPKTVLAYSSLSQMGVIAAVLGMGLATAGGVGGAALPAAFYAAHHALAKGAMFLAVGVAAATGARRLLPVLLVTAVLAIGLGGLPLTGGALAKLAVKEPLGGGAAGTLASLSAAATTLLMLHFLRRLVVGGGSAAAPDAAPPAGIVLPWLMAAAAAVLVPWGIYLTAGGGGLAGMLSPAALWEAVWPVLAGSGLALGLWWRAGRLPPVPEGDLVVIGEGATRALARWRPPLRAPRLAASGQRLAAAAVRALAGTEGVLRAWPTAGLSLLVVAILFGMVLVAGR